MDNRKKKKQMTKSDTGVRNAKWSLFVNQTRDTSWSVNSVKSAQRAASADRSTLKS